MSREFRICVLLAFAGTAMAVGSAFSFYRRVLTWRASVGTAMDITARGTKIQ